MNKLSEIIGNENPRLPYEMRELALDNLLQFLRIPAFAAEVYVNYDCNLYCTNLLEDLVKLLSKNSLLATLAIYTIHQLSLDGLLTIVSDIERNCLMSKNGGSEFKGPPGAIGRHSRNNSSVEKIILESNDLNATTSGGEESGVENIYNIINVNRGNDAAAANGSAAGSARIDQGKNLQTYFMTHDQLMEIKNKKHVSCCERGQDEEEFSCIKICFSPTDVDPRHGIVQSTARERHPIPAGEQLLEHSVRSA